MPAGLLTHDDLRRSRLVVCAVRVGLKLEQTPMNERIECRQIISNDSMPAPDDLVLYSEGCGVVMFHYLTEGVCNTRREMETIAREHGFEIRETTMPNDHPLMKEYADGASGIPLRWEPEVPEGWKLGGKHDTEDGPFAYFIRKIEPKQAAA